MEEVWKVITNQYFLYGLGFLILWIGFSISDGYKKVRDIYYNISPVGKKLIQAEGALKIERDQVKELTEKVKALEVANQLYGTELAGEKAKVLVLEVNINQLQEEVKRKDVYEHFFNDNSVPACISGPAGKFKDVNQAFLIKFIYRREDLIGQNTLRFFPRKKQSELLQIRAELEEGGLVEGIHVDFLMGNGEWCKEGIWFSSKNENSFFTLVFFPHPT